MAPHTLVIQNKKTSPVVLAVLVILSFGFIGLLLLLAWAFDRTPKLVDDEGLTVGRGHRRLWRDLTEVKPIVQHGTNGALVGARLELRFSTGNAVITPSQVENGREVIERIEQILGRKIDLPR